MDYYKISAEALGRNAKIPLVKLGDPGEVFYELALEMIHAIRANNAAGKPTVLICPVGPVGQYPIFVRLVNEQHLSLKNCWFLNMDEYLAPDKSFIETGSPLSFRGFMEREVYGRIDAGLLMPPQQRVFPTPKDPEALDRLVEQLGGVDIVFGGIGINGHLAFNEAREDLTPQQFAALGSRVVALNPETRTANAIGSLNGALDAMPTHAVTVGMRQILGARKIRLGVFRPWHRSVIRQAAYGPVTAHFPASLLQNHPDARIYVTAEAARQPF